MAKFGTHNLGDNSVGTIKAGKARVSRAYSRLPSALPPNHFLRTSVSYSTFIITGLFLLIFFTFLTVQFISDYKTSLTRAENHVHSAASLNAAHLDTILDETNAILSLVSDASVTMTGPALAALALKAEATSSSIHRIIFVDQFGSVLDQTGATLTTDEAGALKRTVAGKWGLENGQGDATANLIFPAPGTTPGKGYFTLSHAIANEADLQRYAVALLPANLMEDGLSLVGTRPLLGKRGSISLVAPNGQTQTLLPLRPNSTLSSLQASLHDEASFALKNRKDSRIGYLDLPSGDILFAKRPLKWGADFVVLMPTSDAMTEFRRSLWLYGGYALSALCFALAFASILSRQVHAAESSDHMLEQSEQLFDLAAISAKCGIWNWNLDSENMYWSNSIMKLLGFDSGGVRLTFDQALSLVHPNDRKYLRRVENSMRDGQNEFDTKFRLKHADGHFLWMRARGEVRDARHRSGEARHRSGEDSAPERTFYGIIIDMTDELMATAREEQARMTLNNAIESISDGFVLWDRNRQIVLTNSKYETHAPFGADEAWDALDEDLEKEVDDGHWLQIKSNRISGGGIVTLSRDITDLKVKNAALEESRSVLGDTITDLKTSRSHLKVLASKFEEEKLRAEEASRSKTEFLANMSHELRTPLNAIIGFSEIMETGMFGPLGDERYNEYASDIRKSGRRLLELIDDILDMSRIESGKYDVDCQPIITGDLVEDCIRLIESRAKEKSIEIKNDIGSVPKIFVDKGACKHVVLNILSNAVKFSHTEGNIRLSMKSDLHWVTLIVEDNGIGIEKENLDKLGLPFVQFENHREKRFQGSGLGLAISMSLIEMMSGQLTISSEIGRGTKVAIKLPRREMAV